MAKSFKNMFIVLPAAVCLAAAFLVFSQSGGEYDLSWRTIDGGGGVSRGGPYELTGTIGQPDAGTMSGGSYVLKGGFLVGDDGIPESLARWWKLDETSGTIARDYIDNKNGTFSGSDPCWAEGFIGGAIDCNGVYDYFSASTLNRAYNSNNTFSVAGWFKTSQSTGKQTIVGQWGQFRPSVQAPVPSFHFGWQVLVENNKVVARFGQGYGTAEITGTSDVNDGEWHHFALVYPTSSSNAVLYVDGGAQGTPGKKSFVTGYYTRFRIGDGSYKEGKPVLKGGPFNGTIDDIMIFHSALTENEVEKLYESGL